jgi:hypothetical protein
MRPLPVRDQDRLVTLWGETRDRSFSNYPLDLVDARAFARQTRTLESVAFFTYEGAAAVPVREQGRIAQLQQALESGNFFDVAGATPILGRALRPDDDVNGARRVAVLTHRAWQRHFAGDRNVIGRRIEVHDAAVTYTIVGVMPQGLDYPRGTDFWTAIVPARTRPGEDTVFYAAVDLLGRLRATSTPENARDELTAYFRRPAALEMAA